MAAVAVRLAAYGRHYEDVEGLIGDGPDELDLRDNCTVYLARDIATGKAVGTIRMLDRRFGPHGIERYVEYPEAMKRLALIEASRLAVIKSDLGHFSRLLLWKALWLHTVEQGGYAITLATHKKLERHYRGIGFKAPVAHGLFAQNPRLMGNEPHEVLWFPIEVDHRTMLRHAPLTLAFMMWPWHPIELAPRRAHAQLARAA